MLKQSFYGTVNYNTTSNSYEHCSPCYFQTIFQRKKGTSVSSAAKIQSYIARIEKKVIEKF